MQISPIGLARLRQIGTKGASISRYFVISFLEGRKKEKDETGRTRQGPRTCATSACVDTSPLRTKISNPLEKVERSRPCADPGALNIWCTVSRCGLHAFYAGPPQTSLRSASSLRLSWSTSLPPLCHVSPFDLAYSGAQRVSRERLSQTPHPCRPPLCI